MDYPHESLRTVAINDAVLLAHGFGVGGRSVRMKQPVLEICSKPAGE